ncbi:hypothetical protein XTPLMG730_1572 [Xanthomonas translucens pv. phlei]|uniref:Uncharacterized protein n=1 Tax=Xanthomonas graminis pv. phlei TaxID=487906 RepID=A0A0K2ZM97_9XANT|nr:hypothetical protein XTPLMG730_1572 [Xanthomonas translucens pv. phlei]
MTRYSTRRRTASSAAALLITSTLLLGGCKPAAGDAQAKAKQAEKAPDAVPVEVAKVGRRAVAASYSGTAALEARAESQVVAKTSGVALAVLAEEGQQVRAGQPLVRLDPDRARLAVAQSEAQPAGDPDYLPVPARWLEHVRDQPVAAGVDRGHVTSSWASSG